MAEKNILRISLPLSEMQVFSLMLQQGVWLEVQVGCNVTDLLTEQFGIDADYIIERITTLFLDGKAIDNLETAYVNQGATLALSSAMPGLVGTTMRRGGHLAAMRGSITYQSQQPETIGTGRVKIKLFNMVMTELGAIFLTRGICIQREDLGLFLKKRAESFWRLLSGVNYNGREITPDDLKAGSILSEMSAELLVMIEFKGADS